MERLCSHVQREYRCKICEDIHQVDLSKELLEGRERFPFPHAFLHGDLKEYLTILYLDRDLQIRGSEVQNLSQDQDNLFSKDHTMSIVSNLMAEIENLRSQSDELFPKEDLNIIISNLMREIEDLRKENERLSKKIALYEEK